MSSGVNGFDTCGNLSCSEETKSKEVVGDAIGSERSIAERKKSTESRPILLDSMAESENQSSEIGQSTHFSYCVFWSPEE